MLFFFFFFSSRRRHTRSLCDWSSDVCSSDLEINLQRRRNQVFIDAQLLVAGKLISRNLYFFTTMKDVQLPPPEIKANIESAGEAYRVTLQASQIARDFYLSFGDVDAKSSDNYIDLLPGETAQIEIRSKALLDQLRQAMKVISLHDAFLPAQKETVANASP